MVQHRRLNTTGSRCRRATYDSSCSIFWTFWLFFYSCTMIIVGVGKQQHRLFVVAKWFQPTSTIAFRNKNGYRTRYSTSGGKRFVLLQQTPRLLLALQQQQQQWFSSSSSWDATTKKPTSNEWIQERQKKIQQYENANTVINSLANNNRSWKRLRPMIELALLATNLTSTNGNDDDNKHDGSIHSLKNKPSIVDIGTDHGLLAIGLAVTNHFHKVIGVDVSLDALQNGAYQLWQTIQDRQQHQQQIIPSEPINNTTNMRLTKELQTTLEFRHGNGLIGFQKGDVDVICIAGMGTTTMMNILFANHENSGTFNNSNEINNDGNGKTNNHTNTPQQKQQQELTSSLLLHHLNCTNLILQTTSSKPKHLMILYRNLYDIGYILHDERIEYVSNRWYVTSWFVRQQQQQQQQQLDANVRFTTSSSSSYCRNDSSFSVPGSMLAIRKYESSSFVFLNHQHHHNDPNSYDKDHNHYHSLQPWDIFQAWLVHHKQWIVQNTISVQEHQWLAAYNGNHNIINNMTKIK